MHTMSSASTKLSPAVGTERELSSTATAYAVVSCAVVEEFVERQDFELAVHEFGSDMQTEVRA
jgi:hypothetical protein